MIRLSNLRLERGVPFKYGKAQARIICDMEANFTDVKEFYFCVDDEYADWLASDVYDAFLVAMLYPAMCYGEEIEIDGPVSKRIYHNIMHYVQGLTLAYAPHFHYVPIKVKGFADAKKMDTLHIGTGFSGGVDSFSTLADNFFGEEDSEYKIDTLFFFHVGQYGNVKNPLSWERANNRFSITRNFAADTGLNALMMNTNMFDFYLPKWEYDAGVFCRISSVLAFQGGVKIYYISNDVTYKELAQMNFYSRHMSMSVMSDPIIMPLLSPVGLEIVCDGAQHSRTEKTKNIANLPLVQKYLNVCVNSSDTHVSATNCSICSKCLRTMMALDSLGILDKFDTVFDLSKWKKLSFKYKCEQIVLYDKNVFAQDNVDFARANGKHLPNRMIAYLVVICYKILSLPKRVLGRIKRMINGNKTNH